MAPLAPTVRRIAVLAFPDVQILDVVGPLEVFGRTARFLVETNVRARSTYVVEVIGLERGALRCSSDLALVADRAIAQVDDGIDTLLVAGGRGVTPLLGNQSLLRWLREMRPRVRRLGSVCTARSSSRRRACSTAAAPRRTGSTARTSPRATRR